MNRGSVHRSLGQGGDASSDGNGGLMSHPPPESQHQLGVFTRPQAVAAGWSRGALDGARRRGRLLTLRRGIYIDREALPSPGDDHGRPLFAVLSVAAVLGEPGSLASHCSAAVLDDLSVLSVPPRPCLTIQSRRHGTIDDVHLHRATYRVPGTNPEGRIPRTSVARTVVDIARESGVDAGLVTADAALHSDRTSVDALKRALAECVGWPGIQSAIAAVSFADARAESPLESISRLAIFRVGLPRPELQTEVFTADGQWLARTDFLWRTQSVVGEADGLEKYREPSELGKERLRQERLEQAGLTVVRWGWSDALNPSRLSVRIAEAFARAAWVPASERRWTAPVVQPVQLFGADIGVPAGRR